jgi:hypothetical protein
MDRRFMAFFQTMIEREIHRSRIEALRREDSIGSVPLSHER